MIKKRIVIGIIIIIFLIVIAIISIRLFPMHYEAIAVADNLCFGMSPLEVRLQYGRPDEIQKSTVSPEITYIYHTNIEGLPAKLSITFIHSAITYKLYRVDAIIDVNEAEIRETYNHISDICRNAYHCSNSSYEEGDANMVSLIKSNGAISLNCKIWLEQKSVYITVIKTW